MSAGPNVDVMIGGNEVSDSDFISFVIERDMFQPDMAAVVLSNQNDIYGGKFKIGQEMEIKVGDGSSAKSIYKGEIVGFEGNWKGGQPTKLTIRAMNKMHRLLRKRKSVTFTEKTDEQILKQVAGDAGLNLTWKHATSINYKHVYQHNQTDLEFLRTRAARLGCHVWCVGTDLFVKEPDFSQKSGKKYSVDKTSQVRAFTPRMSSVTVVKKVTVKGWNPETKELITGEAAAEATKLGAENAVTASGELGKDETFTVDHPIWSQEEAKAIAKARLCELNLQFITAELVAEGEAEVELGKSVEVVANADAGDPFNGDYYVMGMSHRLILGKGKDGDGFLTTFRLARDGQKKG